MATKKAPRKAGLSPDPDTVVPRISGSEQGFTGLRTINSVLLEEQNRVFRYPMFLKTVAEMKTDPTIAAALNVYRMMMTRVKWTVKPPDNATTAEQNRAQFIHECVHDMEHSWKDSMSEIVTYLEYGFSIMEKVYRRRSTRNGSKFNDGLVGLRKLAPRGQDTIRHWNFSEDGRELMSIGQSLRNMENGYRYQVMLDTKDTKDGLLTIDREKFLLFSADSVKGNPEGKSILKHAYLPYKQMTKIKDQMFIGVAKDMTAIPLLTLPPKMMDSNATTQEQLAYQAYQTLINNMAAGTQRGVIMPAMFDPETKQPIYDLKLLEAKGQPRFDLQQMIKALQTDILVALSADVITSVADAQGSFSIKNSNTNLLAIAVEHRLNEIRDVLNNDLVRQLFELNGWDTDRLPTFEYGDIVDTDLAEFSKFIQRTGSVGMLEADRDLMNKVREVIGVTPKPLNSPVDKENLTSVLASGAMLPGAPKPKSKNKASRAGKGMQPGRSGNGTATIGGKAKTRDNSAQNANNAA